MENFLPKLFSKPIKKFGKDIVEFVIRCTKLYFRPITIHWKLRSRNKEYMYFLMDKNHHYGFLIETIVVKLELMKESLPDYKFREKDIETFDILILKGTQLLELLESEDEENHLRSKEYLIKQQQFFDLLSVKLPELFY